MLFIALDAVSIFYFYCWLLESTVFYYVIAYYVVLLVELYFILALINSCFIMIYYPHLKLFKVVLSKGRGIYFKDSVSGAEKNPSVEEINIIFYFIVLKISTWHFLQ